MAASQRQELELEQSESGVLEQLEICTSEQQQLDIYTSAQLQLESDLDVEMPPHTLPNEELNRARRATHVTACHACPTHTP